MKIRVRYFAQLREMLGLSEEDFETLAPMSRVCAWP